MSMCSTCGGVNGHLPNCPHVLNGQEDSFYPKTSAKKDDTWLKKVKEEDRRYQSTTRK